MCKRLLFFVVFFAFVVTDMQAITWNTNGNGTNWNTGGNWDRGTTPQLGGNANNTANVFHNMTAGNLTVGASRGNVRVKNGATLTITGNLILGGFGKMYVEIGGTLIVNGSIIMTTNSNVLDNRGTMTVGNNITAASASDVFINGITTVGGNVSTGGANADFNMTGGTLNIGGSISVSGNGDMDLNGTVTVGAGINVTGASTDFDLNGGTLDVTGNVTLNGDGNVKVDGAMTVTGTTKVTGSGGATVNGSGSLDVGRLEVYNVGSVGGSGILTWGTVDVNPDCSSAALICAGGLRKDTYTHPSGCTTDPPNWVHPGGINLGTCGPVCAAVVAGTISEIQTICFEDDVAAFISVSAASGGDGITYTYQWQSSTVSALAGFSNIAGATNAIYNHGTLSVTTWFRRHVTSGSCGSEATTPVLVTVNPLPSVTINLQDDQACEDATAFDLAGGAPIGGTYSGNGVGVSPSFNPVAAGNGSHIITYSYTDGNSCSNTATGTLVVNVLPTVNLTLASEEACQDGDAFNLSGGTPLGGTYSGNGVGASPSFNPATAGNGSHTITYSYIDGNSCTSSASDDITVTPSLSLGAVSAAQTICYNAAPAELTASVSGGTGTYAYQWQKSTGANIWVDADGTNDQANYTPPALTVTTQFRRVVSSGPCTGTAEKVIITVYGPLTASTIGSDQTISVGATASILAETVPTSGGTGSYTYQWESSSDEINWSNASGTSTNLNYAPGALSTGMHYRRIETSGACGSVTSNTVTVTVLMRVCSGSAPSAISSTVDGGDGLGGTPSYQWESSTTNAAAGFTDVVNGSGVNETGASLSPGAITQGTWYRRKTTINGCVAYSNVLSANVNGGSPGGVSTNLSVWLKADAGTGSLGTRWEDQSGNGNHYSTVSGPSLKSGDSTSNFNPYIQMTGGGFDAPINGNADLGNEYTILVVARLLPSSNAGRILDGSEGDYCWGWNNRYSKALKTDAVPNKLNQSPASNINSSRKLLQSFVRSSNGTLKHYVNGKLEAAYSNASSANGVSVDINTGATLLGNGASAHMNIYEFIVYNEAKSIQDMKIIHSYLMTKWRASKVENYVSSAGGQTYSVATHDHDVIGIGKECYFQQKQSQSEDDSVKVFVSTLAANNAANGGVITNEVSYIMLGHDGARSKGTNATEADIPSDAVNGVVIKSRIDREWKITNTNFNDKFTIKIESELDESLLDMNNICLLIDDDGDFTSGVTNAYYNGDGSGIQISYGSFEIAEISTAMIPAGTTKYGTIVSIGGTLPVELLEFRVEHNTGFNVITWTTGSEINSAYFEVQKSVDGINWQTIEVVQAAGNAMEEIDYQVLDQELCELKCYYRLNQVDQDESHQYSEIRIIESNKLDEVNLVVYPVPVTDHATVNFTANITGMYHIEVIGTAGASIYAAKLVCVEGDNNFEIDTRDYATGMYYLIVKDAEGAVVDKINFVK